MELENVRLELKGELVKYQKQNSLKELIRDVKYALGVSFIICILSVVF